MKNAKHLKKIDEELMPVAWHPTRLWNFLLIRRWKREIGPVLTDKIGNLWKCSKVVKMLLLCVGSIQFGGIKNILGQQIMYENLI